MPSLNHYIKVSSYNSAVTESIDKLRDYIRVNDCKALEIDVCSLNLIDAVKVSTTASMYHFMKYPAGSVKLFVKDEEVKNTLNRISPRNIKVEVVSDNNSNVIQLKKKVSTLLVK